VPTVFGVTNPYFLRACARCPNVMTIMHVPPAAIAPGTLSRHGAEALAADKQNGTTRAVQKMQSVKASFADMSDLLTGQVDGISLQRGLVCTGHDKQVLA
jgi:hypothetical protein